MTRIVGSRVKINALITILGVVAGGILIGLPGIFLALPTIAILKIIFDRIEDLQPWGLLMGDDIHNGRRSHLQLKKKKVIRS
jgi:predicted PurR-regulated permease PerM